MTIQTTDGLRDTDEPSPTLQWCQWAVATGTVDAILATYATENTILRDGLFLSFRALGANATTTPTFKPDSLNPYVITKRGGVALAAGDIPGADAEMIVRFNAFHTRWELLNPHTP